MKRSHFNSNSHKHSSNTFKNDDSFTSTEMNDFSNNEDFDDEKDENKRKSRNLSEKKRRDQFNLLISELCSVINYDINSSNNSLETLSENSSNNKQKMDKSSILRSAISFLKTHSEVIDKNNNEELGKSESSSETNVEQQTIFSWKPSFLVNDEFIYLMLEALDSFMIIIDTNSKGKIIYISETVIPLLGMLSSQINPKIMNTSDDSNDNNLTIYDLIHEEERSFMEKLLEGKGSDPSIGSFTSIFLHFKDHDINCESDKYQLVRLLGSFYDMNDFSGLFTQSEHKCFVAIGRLQTPKFLRELNFQSSTNDNEFVSRHSLEWKFLYLDHRAPPIIGYLPFEILGTSGYDYYHWNDLEDIVSGHEQLMRTGEGTSCIHRFLTKSQQWIWLQTSYYIAYHQWNSKPEFIVCTHTVVKDSEVSKAKIGKINLKIKNKIDETRCLTVSKDEKINCGFKSESSSEPRSSITSMGWSSNRGSESINSSIDYLNTSIASIYSTSQMITTSSLSNSYSSQSVSLNTQESESLQSNACIVPPKNHSILHEFLQQKHELLEHQIKKQQEELRRVSEQLCLVKAVNNE